MNCDEAQQALVDSLAEPISTERRLLMEAHTHTCKACRQFADLQGMLDARLSASIQAPPLSPGFRSSLRARFRRHSARAWSESLPDIAHVIGCGLAIAVLLFVLPEDRKTIFTAGAGFTAVTYFTQAVLRSAFERTESDA